MDLWNLLSPRRTTPAGQTYPSNNNETLPSLPSSTFAEEDCVIGVRMITNSDESVVMTDVKKPPNFKPYEDVLLARAYASVSTDPINGTDQKFDVFWSNVSLKYNILMVKLPQAQQVPRNADSLRLRWQRTLNKDIQLFNSCYSRLLKTNPSGWNEEKFMEEAKKMYSQQSGGKEFKYDECYTILQSLPKFDPMRSTPEKSTCTSPTNCDGKVMGEDMERPIGTKRAKNMKNHKNDEASEASSLSSFQSSMVSVNKRLVDVMETRMRNDNKKQRHDTWLKQAQFYQAMGNNAVALEYMRKIDMDQANDSTAVALDNLSQIDQSFELEEDV